MGDDVNKTVLVAIMNNKRDFAIAREKHWYRVPVKSAPRNLRELLVQQVAFYFTKTFEDEAYSVRWSGNIKRITIVRRRDLLPDEILDPRSGEDYFKIELGELERLPTPILSESKPILKRPWYLRPTVNILVLGVILTAGVSLLAGCKSDEAVNPSQNSPVVRLVSPSSNTEVSDSTLVEVEASDDKGVVRVEVYVDNALVRSFVVGPYRHTWIATGLPDSTYHIIYAKAYDADGNVGSSNVATVHVVHQEPISPSNVVFPASNVSYQQHVQPLFNQACALSGCHDSGTNQSPLKLTSHGETVYLIPGVVVPGNPENSTLVLRIEGRVGQRMPINLNPVNQNQITGIRTWITEGAQNN